MLVFIDVHTHNTHVQTQTQIHTHTHAHWQTQGSRPGQSDESLSHALLDRFVEAGGNFIDTADVYQFGVSESIIGTTQHVYPCLSSSLDRPCTRHEMF